MVPSGQALSVVAGWLGLSEAQAQQELGPTESDAFVKRPPAYVCVWGQQGAFPGAFLVRGAALPVNLKCVLQAGTWSQISTPPQGTRQPPSCVYPGVYRALCQLSAVKGMHSMLCLYQGVSTATGGTLKRRLDKQQQQQRWGSADEEGQQRAGQVMQAGGVLG